ncbi:hypothetical protein [Pedobacter frigiditerrae]|uniref:hypothetical protein n=1 Tax=Pedobacter frigiditerrae TaxID=2530452 RepID=UPI0029301360|nr:hypothetical protein [Pedobacter frigiditerrae]
MKRFRIRIITQIFIGFIVLNSCSAQADKTISLVASTPIGKELQTTFGVSSANEYDFMKWELNLNQNNQQFILDLNYGESMPNTTGFINGGKKAQISGTYTANTGQIGNLSGKIYELKDTKTGNRFSFLQIDEHIFHLLSAKRTLMVGNSGYSYTLNNNNLNKTDSTSPSLIMAKLADNNKAIQLSFAGRTPCEEIATDNKLTVSEGCFKIKWSIVLNRDPQTLKPSTFTMRRINIGPDTLIGNWQVLKGITAQPKALVYQLKSTNTKETYNLLVGDDNVLFVLDQHFRLYPGNKLHSYTLNVRE